MKINEILISMVDRLITKSDYASIRIEDRKILLDMLHMYKLHYSPKRLKKHLTFAMYNPHKNFSKYSYHIAS